MNKNRVGLGTFPFANVFSKVTDTEAKEIVERFIELGGYYIDTAPLYGFGEVENLLGEALKNVPREKYFLISKCGIVGIEEKEKKKSSKYDDVIIECYKSLDRLKTKHLDLYYVHSPDPNTPFDETVAALTELESEGKIKSVGVSNVTLEQLEGYNSTGQISYVQNRFSLINRSIDPAMQDYFISNSISLNPYCPLERGQLSDMVLGELNLRMGDVRSGLPDWENERLEVVVSWIRNELAPISKRLGISLSQLAIAWILHQPFVGFPIVGATKVEQLEENMKAGEIKLSKKDLMGIDKAYEKLRDQIRTEFNLDVHEFRGLNEKYY